ncbi:MAG: hypothetical protein QNJ53_04795 [Pleurocapsa sp. MO_192.B19]|nr:hypothetical protein [Pleurocapsa sp. MO_192.B19]
MKAIVANVLFGSIFSCIVLNDPACANSLTTDKLQLEIPTPPIILSQALSYDKLPIVPQVLNFVDRILTVNKSDTTNFAVDQDVQLIWRNSFSSNLDFIDNQDLPLGKLPYTHHNEQANLILGFQNTFWPSENNHKYWGLTTIEHWGTQGSRKQKSNLAKLNYTGLAPTLPSGSSALTVSGGGNQNLAKKADSSREFEEFRGGVTYHRGVANHVTMGVGFVYEDLLVGFTQLTYENDRLPVRTTISLLAKESGLNLHSHVRLKPADNFVLNYYNDQEKQKFDLNWGIISGLTLLAKGNSQDESLSTGVKVAVKNEYLSLSAKAALDNNDNLEWKLNSQIGLFQFVYDNKKQKSSYELKVKLIDSKRFAFQCSAFVKYENRLVKHNQEEFIVWGSKLHSGEKVGQNKHLWVLDLGYGSGYHGEGLIANGSVALKPNLFFKLTYQEISAVSDDTKMKLQLSSKSF